MYLCQKKNLPFKLTFLILLMYPLTADRVRVSFWNFIDTICVMISSHYRQWLCP